MELNYTGLEKMVGEQDGDKLALALLITQIEKDLIENDCRTFAEWIGRCSMQYGKSGGNKMGEVEKKIKKEYRSVIENNCSPNPKRFSALCKMINIMHPLVTEEGFDWIDYLNEKYFKKRVKNFDVETLKYWIEDGHRNNVIDYLRATHEIAQKTNKLKYFERYEELARNISLDLVREARNGVTSNLQKNIYLANELRRMINWPTLCDKEIECITKDYLVAKNK
ncbi:MAG TPA: hypothetical protein PLX15_01345 [Candidatus Woesearchaeota archaeon]|nr:hypothetical protein [Candidatus Woesearchaeota archaeon]